MAEINDIFTLENELDTMIEGLSLWELPFQTILSSLFLTIDDVYRREGSTTAVDYASRISYVYPLIKRKAAKAEIINSSDAILKLDQKYLDDIKFLNAYAHFSMLMPQVHRGWMVAEKIGDRHFRLDYPSRETEQAELIDRLFGYLSLPILMNFRETALLKIYLTQKAASKTTQINEEDFYWIARMYRDYRKYFLCIKTIPPEVFEKTIGVSFNDYFSFCAAVQACSDFYLNLAHAHFDLVSKERNKPDDDWHMSEYFEWVVCCLTHKTLGWIAGIANLTIEKLDSILSYFLSIYSNNTKEKYVENSYCGEGFLPPFILADQSILFSPLACKVMLSPNNILYSVNKKNRKIFDTEISGHLEPTLISQLEYIFSFLNELKIAKNVHYPTSETDMMILSEKENVCLNMQVKSTIAPDSARTVERVQDRAVEGMKQLTAFDNLSQQQKDDIVNKTFGTKLSNVNIINLLVVRSCAGSVDAWAYNDKYAISNYGLLASIISNKLKVSDHSIKDFDAQIRKAQEDLIKTSDSSKTYETLDIGDYKIEFPNLASKMDNVLSMNIKSYENLPKFEESSF